MNKYNLMLFPDFKDKAVTLSYDDGHISDKKLIRIMTEYGLKGTFNLNSCHLESDGFVKNFELESVYLKTDNEIAVHGFRHLNLPSLSDAEIVDEILNDRKNLENITGKIITGLAYAFGAYDDRVIDLVKKCGIKYARTVERADGFAISSDWLKLKTTCRNIDSNLLEIAQRFISENDYNPCWPSEPKLFYLWGHSNEFERENGWDKLISFAKIIGNNNEIWYATNGDVYNYINAYNSLVKSVDGKTVFNPTAIDVYIKTMDFKKVKIPKGQTIKL